MVLFYLLVSNEALILYLDRQHTNHSCLLRDVLLAHPLWSSRGGGFIFEGFYGALFFYLFR
jgi:hypothetical protein